jgi:hypothetical protein
MAATNSDAPVAPNPSLITISEAYLTHLTDRIGAPAPEPKHNAGPKNHRGRPGSQGRKKPLKNQGHRNGRRGRYEEGARDHGGRPRRGRDRSWDTYRPEQPRKNGRPFIRTDGPSDKMIIDLDDSDEPNESPAQPIGAHTSSMAHETEAAIQLRELFNNLPNLAVAASEANTNNPNDGSLWQEIPDHAASPAPSAITIETIIADPRIQAAAFFGLNNTQHTGEPYNATNNLIIKTNDATKEETTTEGETRTERAITNGTGGIGEGEGTSSGVAREGGC